MIVSDDSRGAGDRTDSSSTSNLSSDRHAQGRFMSYIEFDNIMIEFIMLPKHTSGKNVHNCIREIPASLKLTTYNQF